MNGIMGCLLCKVATTHNENDSGETKKYSWETRKSMNLEDYKFENLNYVMQVKYPGTINGQQFMIQNCNDSEIYLFDHINCVFIDDCSNCHIFIGPTKGSIFFRNCNNCLCMAACGQFRVRDSKNLKILLCCASKPIIESSQNLSFGCFDMYYDGLEEQFIQAQLSPFNNHWSNVHDFTPLDLGFNWTTLSQETKFQDKFPAIQPTEFKKLNILSGSKYSLVPFTFGCFQRPDEEVCFMLVFPISNKSSICRALISKGCNESTGAKLMFSKEIEIGPDDAERFTSTKKYNRLTADGSVIGLLFQGQHCGDFVRKALDETTVYFKSAVYLCDDPQNARHQADLFFNYAEMCMSL